VSLVGCGFAGDAHQVSAICYLLCGSIGKNTL